MMLEPPCRLGQIEQEERKLVFWSAYMMDSLMACGRTRPRAMLSDDCLLRLPLDEVAERQSIHREAPTLTDWHRMPMDTASLSPFGLVVLTSSILGQCTRSSFQDKPGGILAPWISSSAFASAETALYTLESNSELTIPVQGVLSRALNTYGVGDRQRTTHLVLAHALYHLCHCLLKHPLLMLRQLGSIDAKLPTSFLRQTFQSCTDHAVSLVANIRSARSSGSLLVASIYGYCALVAGSILSIERHSSVENTRHQAIELIHYVEEFMGDLAMSHPHVEQMVSRWVL